MIIAHTNYDDILDIVEIDKQAFGTQGISKKMIESQINIFPEGVFVAKENNKIIGIIFCEIHKEEKFPFYNHDVDEAHFKEGNLLYLSVITIAENFRNKNIGSLLLDKVFELGKKLDMQKIYLPVNKKHPYLEKQVLRFWQKNSYKIIGETNWEVSLGKIVNAYILERLI